MENSYNFKIMRTNTLRIVFIALILLVFKISFSQDVKIVVDVDNPIAKIQPTMWGVFYEDINFAADGGVYAELVKNRSFEFPNPLEGWKMGGGRFRMLTNTSMLIINRGEENPNNSRMARINVNTESGGFCMTNTGFRGIGVSQNNEYRFSIMAAVLEGNVKINVELVGEDGTILGNTSVNPEDSEWNKYESIFTAVKTDSKASLKICFEGEGVIDVDMISLFPVDTWMKREGGFRADLVQRLVDMNPGFIRFPGGCIVEGRDISKRYQWKKTIGNIEDRKVVINRWNDENEYVAPDYFQSFGLGFFEYFQLAEDIGAEPIPILNCGMACQFNTAEVVPLDQLDSYVQDALDLIEFANGTVNSEWGKIRAEMGHPEPFNMKYLGIGNEQWGPQYFERYAIFEKTLQEKHPEILLVASAGMSATGPMFEYADSVLRNYNAPLVDIHAYSSADWFFNNAALYDDFDRNGYKIFLSEYGARTSLPDNRRLNVNTWEAALAEAAFMSGLERNADVVYMASYAPLFAHVDAWQWSPDLIWFDNLTTYGTPNYYVQKLYSTNKGTDLLNILEDGNPLTGNNGIFASAVSDSETKEIILKVINNNKTEKVLDIKLNTNKELLSDAKLIVLSSSELDAMNSIENPDNIFPVEKNIYLDGKDLNLKINPYSFTIIKIKLK